MTRVWLAAALAVVVAGCTPTPAPATPAQPALTAPQPSTAAQGLLLLPIRDADPVGYRRLEFGPAWADVDRNRCDTRSDVLRRDLTDIRPAGGCHVQSGLLHDPYTGRTILYRPGTIQIDHVVSLGDAWRSGANTWSPQRRLIYANYPPNLLATAGAVNEAKGDDTAADWQPTAADYRCRYAAIVINTKITFGLSVTQPEHDALQRLLASCPGQPMQGAP